MEEKMGFEFSCWNNLKNNDEYDFGYDDLKEYTLGIRAGYYPGYSSKSVWLSLSFTVFYINISYRWKSK